MSPRRNCDSPTPFSRQKVCPSPQNVGGKSGKSANNNCKRNGAANRKIFKKEKCPKYLQHYALSFKRCLFNLL